MKWYAIVWGETSRKLGAKKNSRKKKNVCFIDDFFSYRKSFWEKNEKITMAKNAMLKWAKWVSMSKISLIENWLEFVGICLMMWNHCFFVILEEATMKQLLILTNQIAHCAFEYSAFCIVTKEKNDSTIE